MRSSLIALLALGGAAQAAPPVVVELFTSQGCSSCPDADALLSGWGKEQFKKGKLLPLSFNVDYWNYLGWRDLFSTSAYSERQRRYAQALGVGVYTPQMVVAGRSAFVGSDGEKARDEAKRHGVESSVELGISAMESPRVKLSVTGKAEKIAGNPHVFLALFENDLITKVDRGENSGRTLRNDFVVRRLIDLGALKPNFRRQVDESWDAAWKKDHSGAAVFVQDMDTLAISGAASLYPLAK